MPRRMRRSCQSFPIKSIGKSGLAGQPGRWATANTRRNGKMVPNGRGGYAWRSSVPYSARKSPARSASSAASTGRSPVPLYHSSTGSSPCRMCTYVVSQASTSQPGPGQQLRVVRRVGRLPVQLHVPQQRAPPGRGRHLTHDRVRRLVEVARDLKGQPAVGSQPVRPADQQLAMAGHPLQHRVGDDHIGQALRLPVPDIVDHERQPRCLARRDRADGGGRRRPRDGFLDEPAGRLDHLGRAVHAAHHGGGPALGEQGGQVAWAAAHVDHVSGKLCSDPGEQVEERSGALASKPQIKGRVPHGGQSFSDTERHSAGHGDDPPGTPCYPT